MWYVLLSALGTFAITSTVFAGLDYYYERCDTLQQVKLGSSNKIDWVLYRKAGYKSLQNLGLVLVPMSALFRHIGLTYYDGFHHWLTFGQSIVAFGLAVLVEDFIFYWMHRAFHTPLLYSSHKLHHQLVEPFALGAFYSSALENMLINFGPVLIVPFLTNLNEPLLYLWINLSMLSGLLSHSGYRMPLVGFHNTHHEKWTVNLGVGGVADWVFGTSDRSELRFWKVMTSKK